MLPTRPRAWVHWILFLCAACGGEVDPDAGLREDAARSDAGVERDAGQDAGMEPECAVDCDDGLFCNGLELCDPANVAADDDGCVAAETPCLSGQICEEDADTCTTECAATRDADDDGVDAMECGGPDCDDGDADAFPGNDEACDLAGHDEDCDPTTIGVRDLDGDGATDELCCNGTTCGNDCDDLRRNVNRTETEVCDGRDNDCDGNVDEGVQVESWPDTDFDLHGAIGATSSLQCPGTPGWSPLEDDCDDVESPDVHGAQVEICDGIDNNCNGTIDEAPAAATWYLDADDDGFGTPLSVRVSCEPQPGYSLRGTDCDDASRDTNPSVREVCDGRDNNCDGRADFVLGVNDTEDDDGDTYGEQGASAVLSCDPVAGHITRAGDCDDTTANVSPGVPDVCNGVDDDCDDALDEGAPRAIYYADGDGDGLGRDDSGVLACVAPTDHVAIAGDCDDANASVGRPVWYPDTDGDTFGAGVPVIACAPPPDHADDDDDCDDASAAVNPSATEICNGIDDDCNDTIDGAEADTSSDRMNCGMCGNACDPGAACAAGRCESILMIDSGSHHACAIVGDRDTLATTGGRVRCWGANSVGQLGYGGTTGNGARSGAPVAVERFAGFPLSDAIDVCAGGHQRDSGFACAVRVDGTVVCWGNNSVGQLGNGTFGGAAIRATTVPGLSDVVRIGCGDYPNVCAVTSTGALHCWGNNEGSFGASVAPGHVSAPVQILASVGVPVSDAAYAIMTRNSLCYVEQGGTGVRCMGACGQGPCGGAATGTQTYPELVTLPSGAVIEELVGGDSHVCARMADRAPHCWGLNGYGQLDRGSTDSYPIPQPVDAVLAAPFSVAAGTRHTCVGYTHEVFGNRVACFGNDQQGQVGDGAGGAASDPFADDVLTGSAPATSLTDVLYVSGGGNFTCAVMTDGSARCWGGNEECQLGRGTGTCSPFVALANAAVVDLP